jgi:nitronate monooxygenase
VTAPGPGDLTPSGIVVAPMAGGPSTPGLVAAAAGAGALGFLAAGYKTATAIGAEIMALRDPPVRAFGVNVIVPGAPTSRGPALAAYVDRLRPEAGALGPSPGAPVWDDDDWEAKVAVLLADPPPVVSFTFGSPPPELAAAFRAAGTAVWVTVTDKRTTPPARSGRRRP